MMICTVIHYKKLTYYDFAEILHGLTTTTVVFSAEYFQYMHCSMKVWTTFPLYTYLPTALCLYM
jgi:hypothetical protein